MKNSIIKTTLFLITLIFFSCNKKTVKNTITVTDKPNQIEVIDFYGTHRCTTCNDIEANTKYTLETYFSDELKSGKITFQTINVDKKENEQIAIEFQAAGTALFLNVINNKKATKIELTDFAFKKGSKKEVFSNELKQKIQEQLEKI